jgi:soluble cytochrome b562
MNIKYLEKEVLRLRNRAKHERRMYERVMDHRQELLDHAKRCANDGNVKGAREALDENDHLKIIAQIRFHDYELTADSLIATTDYLISLYKQV